MYTFNNFLNYFTNYCFIAFCSCNYYYYDYFIIINLILSSLGLHTPLYISLYHATLACYSGNWNCFHCSHGCADNITGSNDCL